jgi:proteasome lid subunit RPN8/RPN11
VSTSAKPRQKRSKAKPARKPAAGAKPKPRAKLAPQRVTIPRAALRIVEGAAETAWPRECCGLLVGVREGAAIEITRAHPSPNRARDPRAAFEIDPEIWLRLTRSLGDGPEAVIGLYHSHPDGPAEPSPRDLAAAWGPDLVWLVTGVARGKPAKTAAFTLSEKDGKRQFVATPLVPQG